MSDFNSYGEIVSDQVEDAKSVPPANETVWDKNAKVPHSPHPIPKRKTAQSTGSTVLSWIIGLFALAVIGLGGLGLLFVVLTNTSSFNSSSSFVENPAFSAPNQVIDEPLPNKPESRPEDPPVIDPPTPIPEQIDPPTPVHEEPEVHLCTVIWNGSPALRLRTGPSFEHQRIGGLPYGTLLQPAGRTNNGNWLFVNVQHSGASGWAQVDHKQWDYISCNQDIYRLPIYGDVASPTVDTSQLGDAMVYYFSLLDQQRYSEAWDMVKIFNQNSGISYEQYVNDWRYDIGGVSVQGPVTISQRDGVVIATVNLYFPKSGTTHRIAYEMQRDTSIGSATFDYWIFIRSVR